jgi:hypothetical protein
MCYNLPDSSGALTTRRLHLLETQIRCGGCMDPRLAAYMSSSPAHWAGGFRTTMVPRCTRIKVHACLRPAPEAPPSTVTIPSSPP